MTLAFDAPKDVRILRGELERIAKEFEEAETEAETKHDGIIGFDSDPVSASLRPVS